jgi:PleD family two-component response regulator
LTQLQHILLVEDSAADAKLVIAAVRRAGYIDIPFIIVSGTIGAEAAVEAMRAGAGDYVLKGTRLGLSMVFWHGRYRRCSMRSERRRS